MSKKMGETQYHEVPGRIFNSPISSKTHPESRP